MIDVSSRTYDFVNFPTLYSYTHLHVRCWSNSFLHTRKGLNAQSSFYMEKLLFRVSWDIFPPSNLHSLIVMTKKTIIIHNFQISSSRQLLYYNFSSVLRGIFPYLIICNVPSRPTLLGTYTHTHTHQSLLQTGTRAKGKDP